MLDKAIAEIVKSPKLPAYIRQLQAAMTAEQKKRRQFYEQIDENDKVEFINGEIIFHSPVRLRHNAVGIKLLMLLNAYVNKHDLGFVGYEKLMISLSRNDYEPDLCYFTADKARSFSPDQMRFPAPDLVVEILSNSTAERDRGIKMEDYSAHGIDEYWIIDPEAEFVEQYWLTGEQYVLHLKLDSSGVIHSRAVAGFEIPVRALFDQVENGRTLAQIMATDQA